jgi:hypothetical protein
LFTGSLCQCNKVGKGNKINADWKGRNKLSLKTDDMIIYVEKPKNTIKK